MAKINAACSYLAKLDTQELESYTNKIAQNFPNAHLGCENWSAYLKNELILWAKSPTAYALWRMVCWKEFTSECLAVPQGDKRWGKSTPYTLLRSKVWCAYADWSGDVALENISNSNVINAIDSVEQVLSCSREDAVIAWQQAYEAAQKLVAESAFGACLTDADFMPIDGFSARKAVVNMFGRLVVMPFVRGSNIVHVQKKVATDTSAVVRWRYGIYEQAQSELPQAVFLSQEGRWSDDVYQRIFAANRRTFSSEQEQAAIKEQFPDFVAACQPFAEMPDLSVMVFVPALMNHWLKKTTNESETLIALCDE